MEVTATLRDVPNKMFMSVIGVTNRSGKVADVVPFTFTVQIMDPVGPQRQALAPERALLNWTDGTGRTEQFNQTISQFALRANSVNPNASISGGVWFPRDKDKFREVLIRIPLAGMVYEFPFYFQVR